MDILTGTLVAATLINMARNLWELTFAIEDDPANERRYRYKSKHDFRKSQIRHFELTTRGNKIIKLEPLD